MKTNLMLTLLFCTVYLLGQNIDVQRNSTLGVAFEASASLQRGQNELHFQGVHADFTFPLGSPFWGRFALGAQWTRTFLERDFRGYENLNGFFREEDGPLRNYHLKINTATAELLVGWTVNPRQQRAWRIWGGVYYEEVVTPCSFICILFDAPHSEATYRNGKTRLFRHFSNQLRASVGTELTLAQFSNWSFDLGAFVRFGSSNVVVPNRFFASVAIRYEFN